VPEEAIWTSALATARILEDQHPAGTAFVIDARLIATNPDPTGPAPDGRLPATGSVAALISRARGIAPYFVGKPTR
jgi:5'-nucleotidase